MTPSIRTLVLIDTASRMATRILCRRHDGRMPIHDETTAADIEVFRCRPGIDVFNRITQQLTDK